MNKWKTIRLARTTKLLGALLVAFVLFSGCSRSFQAPAVFCEAAENFDQEVVRASPSKQVTLWRVVAKTAPEKIKADARTVLEAYEDFESGVGTLDNPDVEAALGRVQRYAIDGCGFYESDSPGRI